MLMWILGARTGRIQKREGLDPNRGSEKCFGGSVKKERDGVGQKGDPEREWREHLVSRRRKCLQRPLSIAV